jgi:peptidoglycan/LPS O-acetylase OafA/YrhL
VVLVAAAISFLERGLHDVRASSAPLFYCANCVILKENLRDWTPVAALHMWTLAVEEQFYLVLPLVLFAARRAVVRHPVRVATIALVGAVASTVWMGVLVSPTGDPSRGYLGSDSHAMGLLVGVALGVLAGVGAPWEAFSAWVRSNATAQRGAPLLAAASLVDLRRCATPRSHSRPLRGGFRIRRACWVVIAGWW